ncbi:hypothetical protein PHMEG_00023735 [Phytophthora megakarya]|uniref:FYVE-type domain-containing protein n=1 Tax=Phytophthora megakarya TaxID=4795 RepID=A0A225VG43_9STRA|nr:hypothetical protein PHMEG_00023735 [Phytophthora megakarya]
MSPSPSASSRVARSDDELPPEFMPTMRFPLPAGYFGNVQVSAAKRQEYGEIVRRRVSSMLADEYRYTERRAQQHPAVQQTEWKFFRRIGDLKVYQRRSRGRTRQEMAAEEDFPEAAIAVERGNPSMLANGCVSGTIEDMLYGVSGTTQEEMLTMLSLVAPPHDAVLLNVVERSTVEDPLHSAEILWVLTKLPIVNPRDVCYLKATGVGRDGKGNRYGYLVLHSVDLPEVPPFDYRKTKILRAKMFFSFLFREVTPGYIDVMGRGIFDLAGYIDVMGRGIFDLAGGELLKLVLPHATTAVIDGLLRGVSCGEAKKLTLLALRNQEERKQFKTTKKSVCSMCIRKKKGILSGVRLRSCDVCGVPICKNCKLKDKRMFTGTKHPSREVVCCATCSQEAKSITGVRLGVAEFSVVAEFYSKKRTISSSASSRSAGATQSTLSLEASTQETVAPTGKSVPTSLLSEATSSIGVTNSTIDDSCAGFDLDVSFSGTLSDLNSGDYGVNSGVYDDLEEEPKPLSADLLKEHAALGDVTEESFSKGYSDEDCKPSYQYDAVASQRRPDNMLEWMMKLQSSAEEAYFTAKANEEIMKKSMRSVLCTAHLTTRIPMAELRPVGVPLSPGCFQATESDRERYATLVQGRVDSMLRDEARYAERRARNDSILHAGEWKQVKKERDLTFYRRFQRGRSLRELALEEELPEIQRAVERGYTSMICDGFVKGTIEDMMLGMTAASQDDLMTGFSYKDPPKDCVWLGTVESATTADPFHTADLIWALPKLPPVLDQVDVCYLKATGVKTDNRGERYGYLVLHGVHVAPCPPFAAHGISRAKMYFACLFREPRPGILKVTVKGIFDLSKKVRYLKGLVSAATTSIMVGLLNGVGIGEAKKLTILARRNRSRLEDVDNIQRQSLCYMCCKRASFLGRANLFGTHLVTCFVCAGTVCSNCTRGTVCSNCTRGVKQRIFLGSSHPCSKVECCSCCVREAVTTIHVHPEAEFPVIAEFYLNQRSSVLPVTQEASQNEEMKTNSATNVPTISTTGESTEYQLDFDDDPFSLSLALPELRRSSVEDVEPDLSPEDEAGSPLIKPWRHRISLDDDDFIPASAIDIHADGLYEMEQRLYELNMQAEYTYAQTQETTMSMRRERR